MASRLETLTTVLQASLGELLVSATTALGEITAMVKAENLLAATEKLRDSPELKFEQLIDLCGMDYSAYGSVDGDAAWDGQRYAVVYHLLSISYNCRLRLRVLGGVASPERSRSDQCRVAAALLTAFWRRTRRGG